jgi:GGDEF domain-containing protein
MFVALAVFGAAGCVESLRGELFATRTAWALAIVLGLQCVYYTVRTVVLVTLGPESAVFQAWLGTVPTSFLVVTFTIVTIVATSVLRAGRTQVRGVDAVARATGADVGIMLSEQFTTVTRALLTRAQWRQELVAVFSVRIDDLEEISTAFGSEVARGVIETWRYGVRRHAPAAARIGQDGVNGLVVATVVSSAADARRVATRIGQGVFEDLRAVPGSVIPDVGVGVALSDTLGSDLDALLAAARADSAGGEPVAHAADGLDPSRL